MSPTRINRRNLLRTGAVGTAALALSSTRGTRAADEGGTVRVYWSPNHVYDAYKEVISQFEKDHPGWKVNWEHYQWPDMRTKLLADFAAGNPPDLVEEPGGWVQEFALAGNLKSLQPYVDADGKSFGFPADWQPYTVKRNSIKGEVYGVQLHLTCILVFYNKEMFADAKIKEPPTTWEEFLAAAQATTKNNVFGFIPNSSADYSWPWLLQDQVRYYDPKTNTIPMANDAAYEAMQYQADLIHKQKVAPVPSTGSDYLAPRQIFAARRAAMMLTGPWDIKTLLTGTPDLQWDIAQALTHKVQATSAAGTSLMIPKAAKNPDLAWDLLKRFVALDVEVAVTKEANQTMPRKSWSEQPAIKANDRIAPFSKGLSYAQDVGAELRLTGHQGEIDELLTKAYQEVIFRDRSASDALGAFVDAANKILAG